VAEMLEYCDTVNEELKMFGATVNGGGRNDDKAEAEIDKISLVTWR